MNEDDPYIDINLRDETARVVYPTRREGLTRESDFELSVIENQAAEIGRLQAELARVYELVDYWHVEAEARNNRLEAIKTAFQVVYDATPPVFQGRWDGVKRLLDGE